MPELPEVETVVRNLRNGAATTLALPGRRIQSAELLWERTLAEPTTPLFYGAIAGQRVNAVDRRAKFIVIRLDMDTLLVHLRMSGDLRVENQQEELLPHDRALILFEDGTRLVFNDARKFGRIWLVRDSGTVLGGLGPEPLEDSFTPGEFHRKLQSTRRQIKPLLLDQSFLAGLGNIYTDEALFMARIHPHTPSDSLSAQQAAQLLQAIRAVLQEGIRRNGASIDWVYRGGDFQNHFAVYQRTGEPCTVCGTPIQRIVVGQRGTHFCPHCQVFTDSNIANITN